MKTLYLIRHAKSSWSDTSLRDIDRPLNNRGERDAPNMAKRLKEKRVLPDMMLSSPANRALTTCKTFAYILDFAETKIEISKSLYHADEDTILAIIQNTPAFVNTLLVFGHNPGFTDFATALVNERISNIPTTGIVGCTFPIKQWDEVQMGKGNLILFDYPKRKD